MRAAPALLIAFMCLSLLTLQMSGLHLHVSADSRGGALHGTHLHGAGLDGHGHGHDHDADVDTSPFEPGTASSKPDPFLVTFVIALLAIIWASETVWPPLVERLTACWRSRWRPPLRAPPQHSN